MMQVTAVRHHGFAQVPRLITRGTYKTLSLIEKGLYTCLKDICGDAGECFYTLRSLAKEINTSISTLSRYIPRLVKAGLIIAQKKIQAKNKHEVYHIAVVNIWQENDATYRPQEIVSDRNKVDEIVAVGNKDANSVSDSNKDQEIVSDSNKDCFYLNDRIRTSGEEESVIPNESVSENISVTHVTDAAPFRPYAEGHLALKIKSDDLEALTVRLMEDVYREHPPADLSTPVIHTVDTPSHIAVPISNAPAPPKETRKRGVVKKVVEEKPAIQLTEQQQAFWLLWCDIWFNQDIPPELNETAYKHVKKLAPLVKTKEQLEDLIKHARVEMEASGFKRKVVHLGNLVNSYPGWKQQSRPISPGTAVPQNFTGMGRLLHIKPQETNRGQTFTS